MDAPTAAPRRPPVVPQRLPVRRRHLVNGLLLALGGLLLAACPGRNAPPRRADRPAPRSGYRRY